MNLDLKNANHDMFVFAAFRYALGRETTAVECVANVLCDLDPELSYEQKSKIVHEIEEAVFNGHAGRPDKVKVWKKVCRDMI